MGEEFRVISAKQKSGPASGLDVGEKNIMTPRMSAWASGWVPVPFSEMGRQHLHTHTND